jgi:hypothetical protein
MIEAPTLPPIKHHEDQQVALTDTHRLTSKAAVRVAIGNFWEEATRILFAGRRRITTNAVDHCPDVDLGDRGHLEVKSVGAHRQGILYQQQIDQARRLLKTGQPMHFVYWCHRAPCDVTTREELYDRLARKLHLVMVIPARRIVAWCDSRTPTIIHYRSPGTRERDDRPGYRLSWRVLQWLARGRSRPFLTVKGVYGHDLHAELAGSHLGDVLPPLTDQETQAAEWMRLDLAHHRLTVVLQAAPQPRHRQHKVRVVVDENPAWYRALARTIPARRRQARRSQHHDSGLERRDVVPSLGRLAAGVCEYPYDWLLRPLLKEEYDEALRRPT